MTEKQKIKIDELIGILPDNEKDMYREIAEHAVELGYLPSKAKNLSDPVAFSKKANNCFRKLCQISPPNPAKQQENTVFSLSFYTVTEYSEIFHEAVKKACESRKTKVGVNGCGNCIKRYGQCTGYTYIYPCGKKIMCCHDKLITLPTINAEYLDEIKNMMKTHHERWMA